MDAIALTVNGQDLTLDSKCNILELLKILKVSADGTAVAKNGEIIPHASLHAVLLNTGDVVEIVRAVGGG